MILDNDSLSLYSDTYPSASTLCSCWRTWMKKKKAKDKAKRENAQPIVEEIEKVLKKYRVKE